MPNPTAALLVIGNEILSGRTRDANAQFLAKALGEQGIELKEVRMIADDHERIVEAVRALSGEWDILFTSGGIGPTHDDITADAVAAAFAAPIGLREDARRILEAYYSDSEFELNEARLRMARIPAGARLIENPVSGAPGFVLGNVHVCAGVPRIFQAMVAAVLPGLARGRPVVGRSIRVERPEGEIAETLAAIARDFAELSFGSYPFIEGALYGSNIVVRGIDEHLVEQAAERVRQEFGL